MNNFFRDPVDVRLGDIQIHTANPNHHPAGPHIYLDGPTALDDWHKPPQDATQTWAHTSGDGLTSGIRRLGGRHMNIPIVIEQADSWGMYSLPFIHEMLTRQYRNTFRVQEAGFAREVDVRVIDAPITREAEDSAEITLMLVADDPLRYNQGWIDLPNGSTGLPNCGNRTAYPIVELTGPIASLTIQHPGGTFAFTVPTGAHTIDSREGIIWGPNHEMSAATTTGPWPVVPPGGAEWVIGGSMSSAGTIKVRRWEAWT